MQQVQYENEMSITYTHIPQGILLLRCQTRDTHIRLPHQLDGLPVLELGDYLCAQRQPDLSNWEIKQVHFGGQVREHSARTIQQVHIPPTVKKIGNYTFYNCTALEVLELPAQVEEVGHGILMNCLEFHQIELQGSIEKRTCLPDILGQTSSQIVVKENQNTVHLIFPPYYEELQDLTPAHVFQRRIEGAGYTYRQCFENGILSFSQYDAAIERLLRLQDYQTACQIALCRLRFPFQLNANARSLYLECLHTHHSVIVSHIIKEGNSQEMQTLLSLGVLDHAAIQMACDMARASQKTEILALLLAALGVQTRQTKCYDL